MERLTDKHWRNLDPWECCGQDSYCQRGCPEDGGCTKGCIVPRVYARLAAYEETGLEPEEINQMRHGRWINNTGGFWEVATCSECGERVPTVGVAPNYCPNCGAKMDGAEEKE